MTKRAVLAIDFGRELIHRLPLNIISYFKYKVKLKINKISLEIRLILAVLVVLLVIISVYIVTRRHIKHRKDDQNRRIKELEQEVAEMKNSTLEKYDN